MSALLLKNAYPDIFSSLLGIQTNSLCGKKMDSFAQRMGIVPWQRSGWTLEQKCTAIVEKLRTAGPNAVTTLQPKVASAKTRRERKHHQFSREDVERASKDKYLQACLRSTSDNRQQPRGTDPALAASSVVGTSRLAEKLLQTCREQRIHDFDALKRRLLFGKNATSIGQGSEGTCTLFPDSAVVAKQFFRRGGASNERILREVFTLVRVKGTRNCCNILSYDHRDGIVFMSYNRFDLVTFASKGLLNMKAFRAIVPQIFNGYAEMFNRGIVHRDLKPENILVDADTRVFLADFGHSRFGVPEYESNNNIKNSRSEGVAPRVRHRLTSLGEIFTDGYRPPEVGSGALHYDHRADMWSLGAVLYELLMNAASQSRSWVSNSFVRCETQPRSGDDHDAEDVGEEGGCDEEGELERSHRFMSESLEVLSEETFGKLLATGQAGPANPREGPLNRRLVSAALDLAKRLVHPDPSSRLTLPDAVGHPLFALCAGGRKEEEEQEWPSEPVMRDALARVRASTGFCTNQIELTESQTRGRTLALAWLLRSFKRGTLNPQTYMLSVQLLDTYMAVMQNVDETEILAHATACLLLASSVHDTVQLRPSQLAESVREFRYKTLRAERRRARARKKEDLGCDDARCSASSTTCSESTESDSASNAMSDDDDEGHTEQEEDEQQQEDEGDADLAEEDEELFDGFQTNNFRFDCGDLDVVVVDVMKALRYEIYLATPLDFVTVYAQRSEAVSEEAVDAAVRAVFKATLSPEYKRILPEAVALAALGVSPASPAPDLDAHCRQARAVLRRTCELEQQPREGDNNSQRDQTLVAKSFRIIDAAEFLERRQARATGYGEAATEIRDDNGGDPDCSSSSRSAANRKRQPRATKTSREEQKCTVS